jgi:hypothetical protein
MPDRIRALKVESVAEGGSSDDAANGICEVDIGQDFIDCAGVCVQRLGANTQTADALVRVQRTTAGALHFTDTVANGATGLDLSQLLTSATGAAGAFNALQDIRLWVDGPGDGFASGATKATAYVANSPLVASETWYTSAAQTTPLFAVAYTYPANSALPSAITYRLYPGFGTTPLRTMVDTLTYAANSPLETGRSRTWS